MPIRLLDIYNLFARISKKIKVFLFSDQRDYYKSIKHDYNSNLIPYLFSSEIGTIPFFSSVFLGGRGGVKKITFIQKNCTIYAFQNLFFFSVNGLIKAQMKKQDTELRVLHVYLFLTIR